MQADGSDEKAAAEATPAATTQQAGKGITVAVRVIA